MKDLSLNASAFPVAAGIVERNVQQHNALAGRERRCCVHCDAEIEEPVRWVRAGELEREGYYFGPPPAKGETGGACASGCGTCATRSH